MFDKSNDHDNFVPEDEEFLPLHDFLGEEKQGKVLLFKDNFGNNSDDLNYVKKHKHKEDTDNDIFIDTVENRKSQALKLWEFFQMIY